MSPRPAIFISAVSKELRSARQLVANTLTFLGYEPEWQDIFSTEEGDLRGMLRRRVDACKGVVQLVGQCYGAEPPTADEQFGRVSYTQYEALYARQQKKKVWYLILNDDFTTDPHEPEPQELQGLQVAYRKRLKSENLIRHSLSSPEALEANVLKLRDELTRLRRGVKQWAAGVAVLLVLSVGLGVWLLQRQQSATSQLTRQGEKLTAQDQRLAAMDKKMDQLLKQGVTQFAEVQTKVREEQPGPSRAADVEQRTYEELAKRLGVGPKLLQEKLPQFANQLKNAPDASAYERANAAYVAKDYSEAERLALAAADEAERASAPKTPDAIKALDLAGNSADARIEYARALQHFRDAAKLTDRARDPLEWASQQWSIAKVLREQGNYAEAEKTYRNVLEEYHRARGGEDRDVLALRNNLAVALQSQGKYAEAETECRAVIKLEEKVLGPEHPNTLGSRNNLALALNDQGKYAEAETECRAVIKLEEKVLGPEHPDTLGSRTNLAVALQSQGKYAEAETEFRAVLKLEEKVLGPEHPSTLGSRNNLANVLAGQGKYAEAEAEYREVIKLREKVLGPEHPNTLSSCFNLALCLKAENKTDEAKEFARRAAQGANKILGVNHPDVLKYAKVWQELQNNGASTGAPDSAPAQDIGAPAGASSADDVSSIPEKVVQGFSAPDVDALGSMYAGTVDYLDSGRISSAAVRNQLAEYFARWPVRQWEVVGPVKVESLGASVQQVVFSAKYDLSDPDSKRHASGIAKETLMIAPDSSGAMKIISHHETTKASSGSHSSSSKTSERRSDRQKVYKERLVIPQLPGVPWP